MTVTAATMAEAIEPSAKVQVTAAAQAINQAVSMQLKGTSTYTSIATSSANGTYAINEAVLESERHLVGFEPCRILGQVGI